MSYPYPGFSWSISHHIEPATNSRTMFELLQAAYVFADEDNYQDKITDHIISQGLLTENIREDAGRPQLWRDYQQVLPELGLITSTRFTKGIAVTPVGMMWLDGALGYSEMITTQCLKYQYPNGHKQDLSPTQKGLLEAARIPIPQTRTELDVMAGVLIKPAVLILRILIELHTNSSPYQYLTTDECLAALVPIKKNYDWPIAYSSLLTLRNTTVPRGDARRRRDLQEWFRLLTLSDLFDTGIVKRNPVLTLSKAAVENINTIRELCEYHEDPSTFWVTSSLKKYDIALSWFDFYGAPNLDAEWIQPSQYQNDEYIDANYPYGFERTEDDDIVRGQESGMNLRPFELQDVPQLKQRYSEPEIDVDRIRRGHKTRQHGTRLHEKIVAILASRMRHQGYSVYEDRRSVDILGIKNGEEAILEIKTTTSRNISQRMRLGVGQLSEYRYRRQIESNFRPASILVISGNRKFSDWIIDYFHSDVDMGLISITSERDIRAYTNGDLERLLSMA